MSNPDVPPTADPAIIVVGNGRAGGSFAAALRDRGLVVVGPLGRTDDLGAAVDDVLGGAGADGDVVVLCCVSDGEVAGVAADLAARYEEWPSSMVAVHVAGSLPLGALDPCARRASVHPLVALPDPTRGAGLLVGATFAVAGDDVARQLATQLDGTVFEVGDEQRVAYHAAAAIASNHLVALLDQAERVAEQAGVPLDAYLPLVQATLDNVAAVGTRRALTGPAARGDIETLQRHLAALDPDDRVSYRAMANLAARMAGTQEL